MDARRSLVLAAVVAAATAMGCSEEQLIAASCRDDSHCPSGNLCEDFRCIAAETKACEVVIDGNPILQPAPYAVSFGEIDTEEATQTLTIHNIGNCTLTLFEASLAGGPDSPFGCELCTAKFPMEIFPGRKREFAVSFVGQGVGSFHDEIKVLSDDREFGTLTIPLRANFIGVPQLRIAPNPVDFGYVAQGRMEARSLQMTNQGTGTAPLTVQAISLLPADTQDFSITPELNEVVTLAPVSVDSSAVLSFDLSYHPRSNAAHKAELMVLTDRGEMRVPLSGNSETPPKLTFNPPALDLGQVPLGHTNYQSLTLVNEGGAPLKVDYTWGGPRPTTDLFTVPTAIPEIGPGEYVEIRVGFTATSVGKADGLLVLSSSDPSRPSVTLPIAAEGVAGPGPEVVKIEMTYDNGEDGAFDSDLRNVDMTLEHPYGYVCNKDMPNPTNWGNYGNPSWIAFGPKEEPERIVLADATQDGTYRVMLQYMEDCASIPTELAAGLLGISVDALIAYLTGGAGNIIIDGGKVGDIIQNVCLSRKASNATVRVHVNGKVIAEKTVSIGRKGETHYALDLVRSNGRFTAR